MRKCTNVPNEKYRLLFVPVVNWWSSLVEGDEGCIGLSGKLLCFWQPKKNLVTLGAILKNIICLVNLLWLLLGNFQGKFGYFSL